MPEPKNRIREWRDRRGLSLAALSERTQPRIPTSTIQKHETTSGVDTRYLSIYAVALGVTTEELLPAGTTLGDQERAVLALFRQLTPERQELLMRLGEQLRGESEPAGPNNQRDDGEK